MKQFVGEKNSLTWRVYTYPGVWRGVKPATGHRCWDREAKTEVLCTYLINYFSLLARGLPRGDGSPPSTHAVMKYVFCLCCLHVCCCITLWEYFKIIMEVVDVQAESQLWSRALLHLVRMLYWLTWSRRVNQKLLTCRKGLWNTQVYCRPELLPATPAFIFFVKRSNIIIKYMHRKKLIASHNDQNVHNSYESSTAFRLVSCACECQSGTAPITKTVLIRINGRCGVKGGRDWGVQGPGVSVRCTDGDTPDV